MPFTELATLAAPSSCESEGGEELMALGVLVEKHKESAAAGCRVVRSAAPMHGRGRAGTRGGEVACGV
jgi:hypothetical protein